MSQHTGPKGRNYAAKARKRPTPSDIARHIAARKKAMFYCRPFQPTQKIEQPNSEDVRP